MRRKSEFKKSEGTNVFVSEEEFVPGPPYRVHISMLQVTKEFAVVVVQDYIERAGSSGR